MSYRCTAANSPRWVDIPRHRDINQKAAAGPDAPPWPFHLLRMQNIMTSGGAADDNVRFRRDSASFSNFSALPPNTCANSTARSYERFETITELIPFATKFRAVNSPVSPAPTIKTVCSSSFPNTCLANSTAA